ncbi:spore coat protein [Tuberibacillus sp. Marseille-P3662]|uniref:spore coat protein n=1 Tax=Tuberibacillus sp. Marseille-P3662 TaxID=1965358 RepID=UPI000A1C96ED|nr:spore coat protein [Tuberibacillus sp. Marseille-P3662]
MSDLFQTCCNRCGSHPCSCSRQSQSSHNRWNALSGDPHPLENATGVNNFDQVATTGQSSDECIIIRDSADVNVHTTSTQAAVGIQLAVQVAVMVILEVSIGDSATEEHIINDLQQLTDIDQSNQQKTIIENSRDVDVTTTDTNLAVTAQIAVQVLVALLVTLDIL